MKIVINACHGGFGLSEEAFETLMNRKGIEFERVVKPSALFSSRYDYYRKGYVGVDTHYLWHSNVVTNRSDPDLVQIVEEFGEKSFGRFAKLKVVEVPDDVEWQLEEYDGVEWIAEKHRTWQ